MCDTLLWKIKIVLRIYFSTYLSLSLYFHTKITVKISFDVSNENCKLPLERELASFKTLFAETMIKF